MSSTLDPQPSPLDPPSSVIAGQRKAAVPPPRVAQQLLQLGRDIKLAHTVFALPFALLAMVLAAAWAQRLPTLLELGLILACMLLARTFAMTVNRLADARIDAANPRTARRAIPAGQLSRRTAATTIIATALLFVAGAAGFWWFAGNAWPVILSPAVLALVAGYSFTKRITALCHVVLGVALASSPLAAAVAIEPGFLAEPTAWLLAGFVAGWVAGFDVIYALADTDFDRAAGLHSMPARLGPNGALWVSRSLHALAAGFLVACVATSPSLHMLTWVAVALVVALLALEHALVWNSSTNRLNLAFFTVNGVISLLLGAAGIVDAWPSA